MSSSILNSTRATTVTRAAAPVAAAPVVAAAAAAVKVTTGAPRPAVASMDAMQDLLDRLVAHNAAQAAAAHAAAAAATHASTSLVHTADQTRSIVAATNEVHSVARAEHSSDASALIPAATTTAAATVSFRVPPVASLSHDGHGMRFSNIASLAADPTAVVASESLATSTVTRGVPTPSMLINLLESEDEDEDVHQAYQLRAPSTATAPKNYSEYSLVEEVEVVPTTAAAATSTRPLHRRGAATDSSTRRVARKRPRSHAAATISISLLDDEDTDDRKVAAVNHTGPNSIRPVVGATTAGTGTGTAVVTEAIIDVDAAWDWAKVPSSNVVVTLDDDGMDRFSKVATIQPSRRVRRIQASTRTIIGPTNNSSPNDAPLNAEWQVLTVFPDADVAFVRASLLRHQNNTTAVIHELMELKSYPKSADSKATASGIIPGRTGSSVIVHMEPQLADRINKTDYMSMESFQPTANYVDEAKYVLLQDFSFLNHRGAAMCLARYKNHFAVCHDKLLQAVKGSVASHDDEGGIRNIQYDRLVAMMSGGRRSALAVDQIKNVLEVAGLRPHTNASMVLLKHPRSNHTKPLVTDPTLSEEIKYVHAKLALWTSTQQRQRDCALLKLQAQKEGSAVDCPCCCDSYPMDQMIQCQDGHLFCNSCLVSYTNNLIFGSDNLGMHKTTKKLSLELQCLNGDCQSHFNRVFLARALPKRLLHQYDTVQIKLSIQSAGLADTVCTCPECDFVMDVPPGQGLLHCPVASCQYVSCRECGEAAHIPLRCDEVEKADVTKGRLAVEEAITAAKIRKCPSCKKPFIKSDGCNKITCGCGTKSCYICQKAVKDYSHFCQTPHCTHKDNCSKCALYTNAEGDDAAAMRSAGYSALEKLTKGASSSTSSTSATDGKASIDVENILNSK